MRDLEDPALIAHLEAENAYAEARTEHLAPLRTTLFEEIRSRVKETDLSVPVVSGPWWYYARTVEGKQYASHVRAPLTDPAVRPDPESDAVPGEQVVVDGNVEAGDQRVLLAGRADRERRPPARRVRGRHRGRRALRPHGPRGRDRRGPRHLHHRHRLRRRVQPRRPVPVLHPARRRLAPAPAVAAPRRRRPGRRRARAPGGRRAVLDGRLEQPRRALAHARPRLEDHVRGAPARQRRPRGAVARRGAPPRGRRVRRRARRRPAPRRAQHRHPRRRPRVGAARRDEPRAVGPLAELRRGRAVRLASTRSTTPSVLTLRAGGLTALRVLPRDPASDDRSRRAVGRRGRPGRALDRPRGQPRAGPDRDPGRRRVVGHAAHRARRRPRDPRADAAQAPARPRRLRRGQLHRAPRVGHDARRHAHPGLGRPPRRRRAGRHQPRSRLGLRRLRDLVGPVLLRGPAQPARPRRRLRGGARARWRRDGAALVRRRQAARQAEHVLRHASPASTTSSPPGGSTRPASGSKVVLPEACSWVRCSTSRPSGSGSRTPPCPSSTR